MADRIACAVPFCRRTASREKFGNCEIICGKHWRTVSAATKKRHALAKRLLKHSYSRGDRQYLEQGGLHERQIGRFMAMSRLESAIWERCKREAIERAAGIGG